MEISAQIDLLISKLNELKPLLNKNAPSNTLAFNNVLNDAIKASSNNESIGQSNSDLTLNTLSNPKIIEKSESEVDNKIPRWVNSAYDYDPLKPRKPNLREVIEAISGKSIEELQAGPISDYTNYSKQAATLLYSVVGDKVDTRDWSKILSSGNVVEEARAETAKLHKPTIEIKDVLNADEQVIKQYAILKSSDGLALHTLSGTDKVLEETLKNYGVSSASVPNDIESKIVSGKFDPRLLDALKKFDKEPNTNTQVIPPSEKVEFTTNLLVSNGVKDIIPEEEFEKL